MALNKEIWLPVVEDQLFSNYEILKSIATDDSSSVVKSGSRFRKVHIANAGASAGIRINGTGSEEVARRTDTDVEYALDKYETLPMAIDREDTLSVSYDKIQSVSNTMVGELGEAIMYNTFKNWYPGNTSDFMVDTSGEISGSTNAPGATGNRKVLTYKDVLKASEKLSSQKVPTNGRVLLLPTSMAHQLVQDFTMNSNLNVVFNEKDGMMVLNTLIAGFKVVEMPFVVYSTSTGTSIRDYGNAGTTTDQEVAYAFHPNFVSVAKDEVHLFYNEGNATEYADILSAQAFAGGKYRRTDKKGIIAIKQSA